MACPEETTKYDGQSPRNRDERRRAGRWRRVQVPKGPSEVEEGVRQDAGVTPSFMYPCVFATECDVAGKPRLASLLGLRR